MLGATVPGWSYPAAGYAGLFPQSMSLAPASVTVSAVTCGASPGVANVALSPASVSVAAQSVGFALGTASLPLTPASIIVLVATLASSPGAVSLALTPTGIAVAAVALGVTSAEDQVIGLSPATIATLAQALGVESGRVVRVFDLDRPPGDLADVARFASRQSLRGY